MKELIALRHGKGGRGRGLLDEADQVRHVDGEDDFGEGVGGEDIRCEAGVGSETLSYENIPYEVGADVSGVALDSWTRGLNALSHIALDCLADVWTFLED